MQTPKLPRTRRAISGIRLGSLVSVLLFTATLTTPDARGTALKGPPAFPDGEHVSNGCYVSTIGFLARFRADFPGERGEPLVIVLRNADGARRSHTIAVITWRGEWWGRDEYFGVFALGSSVRAHPDPAQLASKAEIVLERHATNPIRSAMAGWQPAPATEMSSEQRIREVTAVVRMAPVRATVFWVKCGRSELPVVFFRPGDRQIAVYDPLHGTSVAESACPDDAKIVAAFASRLGYHVDGVRADRGRSVATLVASVKRPLFAWN